MNHIKWTFLLLLASILGPLFFIFSINQFSDTKPVVALVTGSATTKDIAKILFGHICAAAVSSAALGFLLGLITSQKPKSLGLAAGGVSSAILLAFYFKAPTSTKLSIYSIELLGLLVFILVCTVFSHLGYRLKAMKPNNNNKADGFQPPLL
jgi:hypothetical protein